MSTALWIFLGVSAILVLGYVLTMLGLFRKSRELEKQIDYSKIRKWKDEESKD